MNGLSQWARSHKPQVAAIAAAVVVAIAVASGAFATSEQQPEQQEPRTVDVTLSVTADHGWDENSTPAIAHIEGNDVDFYHAVTPDADGNKGTSTVALAEGDYTVSFVSPVNSDGSAFDIYDTGAPVDITVDADAKNAPAVNCPMAQIPADKVTDDMLADIVNKTKQEATDADKDVDVNDKPAQTTPSAKNDDNKADSNAGSKPSNNGSSNSGNSGSASSKPSQPSQPSKPAHTHTWVNHTATRNVWVSNWVDVPDYGTQQVAVGTKFIFAYDGYTTTDINDAKAHAVALIKQGLPENYRNETIYETQQVQTGSHKEDHGYNKTESYVDYVYCSSCGARQ